MNAGYPLADFIDSYKELRDLMFEDRCCPTQFELSLRCIFRVLLATRLFTVTSTEFLLSSACIIIGLRLYYYWT